MELLVTDEKIWEVYMQGFNDCGERPAEDRNVEFEGVLAAAYRAGWSDFILGDDISSVDERPKEETIRLIKINYSLKKLI